MNGEHLVFGLGGTTSLRFVVSGRAFCIKHLILGFDLSMWPPQMVMD
jgi:hypothetical protein